MDQNLIIGAEDDFSSCRKIRISLMTKKQPLNEIDDSSAIEMLAKGNNMTNGLDGTNQVSLKFDLPYDYQLPPSLLNHINNGDLTKFNSHCENRQILIDVIFYDFTKNYKIWYVEL